MTATQQNDIYLIAHIGHTSKHCDHITWWNPDSRGYTYCIHKAGRYSAEQCERICTSGLCVAFRVDNVESLARSTPYYRRENGSLSKLYDAEHLRVVPNSRDFWRDLMAFRAFPQFMTKTAKPTPIGAKAVAIYLDAPR